ncbi:MAG TPA: DUF2914 domain-containing protein [Rhizomicrobium sp.]|jgi:hypothetical protein
METEKTRRSFWRRAKPAQKIEPTVTIPVATNESGANDNSLTAKADSSDAIRVAQAGAVASGLSTVAGAWTSAHLMRKAAFGWVTRHERILSGGSMVGGYAFDNYSFRRIDLPNTQLIFIGYLGLAALAILISHAIISRARSKEAPLPRWHSVLPMASQFALGGLWSAFFVFYSRGAVLTQSWPFLLVLAAIFIGNEVFKHYASRLAFSAILFFFAVFSYAIVTMPILTRNIGTTTFLLSGAVAVGVFWIFLKAVASLGRTQWKKSRWWVMLGGAGIYAAMNLFYFTGVLPPLPLALSDSGVYHFVAKDGTGYKAVEEPQPWTTFFGATPVIHVAPGQPLYVYGAVFAPIRFAMNVVHRWQHYDPVKGKWHTVSTVTFPINGGRDGGYRGYTVTHHVMPGDWRVDVSTGDGHIIGRVRFDVEETAAPALTVDKILN